MRVTISKGMAIHSPGLQGARVRYKTIFMLPIHTRLAAMFPKKNRVFTPFARADHHGRRNGFRRDLFLLTSQRGHASRFSLWKKCLICVWNCVWTKWRRCYTPPCRAPGCSYTPVAALSAVSRVSKGCRSYTPFKGPCRTPSWTPL